MSERSSHALLTINTGPLGSGRASIGSGMHRQLLGKRSCDSGNGSSINTDGTSRQIKRRKPCVPSELEVPQGRKFACPYYKRNPAKYSAFNSCCGPGWDSIPRLKEHLYRRHALPQFRCHRCFVAFEDSVSLREHTRAPKACAVKETDPTEGFGEEVEKALKSRKRQVDFADSETKWTDVFKLLFPSDDRIPSPYYEHEQHKIYDQTRQDLEGYQEYICRELSPSLREELTLEIEDELELFGDRIQERAVRVIQKLAIKSLHRYRKLDVVRLRGTPDLKTHIPADDEAKEQHYDTERVSSAPADASLLEYISDDLEFHLDGIQIPVEISIGDPHTRSELFWGPSKVDDAPTNGHSDYNAYDGFGAFGPAMNSNQEFADQQ